MGLKNVGKENKAICDGFYQKMLGTVAALLLAVIKQENLDRDEIIAILKAWEKLT